MELYLIRHPRVAVAPQLCYGRSDLPLAGDALTDARRLRALLPPEFTLVSSPLARCRLLAEALAPSPNFDERLTEIDFGAWEMRAFEAIGRDSMDAWAADPFGFRPPQGETADEMSRRVLACMAQWRARECERLVVVSHGGPLRAIAGSLLEMPQLRWLDLDFACGRLTRFDLSALCVRLAWFNL